MLNVSASESLATLNKIYNQPSGSVTQLGVLNDDAADIRTLAYELEKQAERIFCDESRALVDIIETKMDGRGFDFRKVHNTTELDEHLQGPRLHKASEPHCRWIHIKAPHSRERLSISCRMFQRLLVYHQVTPCFVGYIFSFGRQQQSQLHFGGLRDSSRMEELDRGVAIPLLERSGRNIELCYSLKSAELSQDHKRPWSIRQCSLYHSYDLETEKSTWITVKGSDSVRRLIELHARGDHAPLQELAAQEHGAFKTSLATHSYLCAWAVEGWHFYIDFLASSLQDLTRRTLSVNVDYTRTGKSPRPPEDDLSRTPRRQSSVLTWAQKRSTTLRSAWSGNTCMEPSLPTYTNTSCTVEPSGIEESNSEEPRDVIEDRFSFDDLQHVHHIEENVNEAIEVIRSNVLIFDQLLNTYAFEISSEGPQSILGSACLADMHRFRKRLLSLRGDLVQQEQRLQMLQRLVVSRQSLLHGILQYRSMEANNALAKRSQISAERMEAITQDMHIIARKTKVETVSMRIITLVTLFFLPGTFVSTLMDTPIITFSPGSGHVSEGSIGIGALQLFIIVCLPLMLLTFGAWFVVYLRERRREIADKQTHHNNLRQLEEKV